MDAVKTSGAAERAARRRHWPVRVHALGSEPPEDVSAHTSPGERLVMAWRLSVEAWTLSGRALPAYDRTAVPARLFRPGEPRPDDE